MRAVVLAALPGFTGRFEGRLPYMYLDDHKAPDGSPDPLVTCAVGNMIDPVGRALTLPWTVGAGGEPASMAAIQAEWWAVKGMVSRAAGGGGQFMGVTTLRLSDEAIDALLDVAVEANESALRPAFPGWDSFPADAQLGIHSMAYAMGAGFPRMFPKFTAAANRGDWSTAAAECTIVQNPPVARNAANKLLFLNAARGKNPSTLYWPRAASGLPTIVTIGIAAGIGWGAWHLWKAAHA